MQKKQFGRSMIEMLAVLAIIAVLSIGGLLGYRRAVNNHQANVILDDVNRFAFVILERSGLALDAEIDKGDFKESGIYNLKGYQSEEAQGFSITVQSVPKGVCEALLPKAVLEYKVGIVTAGGSVNDEIIYDTLNTDLCKDTNDIAFYFGDTSGICNAPDGDGPCTTNADCCGGEFCAFENATSSCTKGDGNCQKISLYNPSTATMSDGKTWTRSAEAMSFWSVRNWCEAQGKTLVSRAEIGCGENEECSKSDTLKSICQKWGDYGWHWLSDVYIRPDNPSVHSCREWGVFFTARSVAHYSYRTPGGGYALCH